jgi:hypothetical protein
MAFTQNCTAIITQLITLIEGLLPRGPRALSVEEVILTRASRRDNNNRWDNIGKIEHWVKIKGLHKKFYLLR